MAIIVGTLEVLMSKYQIQYITFLKMVLLVNFCHLYLLFPLSPATFNSIEVISVISRWSVLLGLEIDQPRDTNLITQCCIQYISTWAEIDQSTLVIAKQIPHDRIVSSNVHST
jgi:hypothetical protein